MFCTTNKVCGLNNSNIYLHININACWTLQFKNESKELDDTTFSFNRNGNSEMKGSFWIEKINYYHMGTVHRLDGQDMSWWTAKIVSTLYPLICYPVK